MNLEDITNKRLVQVKLTLVIYLFKFKNYLTTSVIRKMPGFPLKSMIQTVQAFNFMAKLVSKFNARGAM